MNNATTLAAKKIYHKPVLLQETLDEIAVAPKQGWIVDGTFGDGGHSSAIFEKRVSAFDANRLLSIDWDFSGLEAFQTQGKSAPTLLESADSNSKWIIAKDNFAHLQQILESISKVTGYGNSIAAMLLDLGISSRQLVQKQRGFSFTGSGKADMRMSPDLYAVAAYDLLNLLTYKKMSSLFRDTVGMPGPLAAKLTHEILNARAEKAFGNTNDIKRLTDIAYKVVPIRANSKGRIHPATLLFLALRIAVNTELRNLQEVLPVAFSHLMPGGVLLVMTYHSAEEQVVNHFLQTVRAKAEIILPSAKEIRVNPRARSAKLYTIKHAK